MRSFKKVLLLITIVSIIFGLFTSVFAQDSKQRIYDHANLLTQEEVSKLENLALEHSEKWETDFIIVTTLDADNKDIKKFTQDYYDNHAPGYDKPHGNTVILALDMKTRDFFLAGFYKGEKYLDDTRLDLINKKITPYLAAGNYYDAFETYILTGSEYMRYIPPFNPESFLFETWFHLLAAVAIGAVVVGLMAYNSGGKVTVNERTYTGDFKVTNRKDIYLTKSVTRQRKPSNKSGGGGGVTGGGHSHSGSRGSF